MFKAEIQFPLSLGIQSGNTSALALSGICNSARNTE